MQVQDVEADNETTAPVTHAFNMPDTDCDSDQRRLFHNVVGLQRRMRNSPDPLTESGGVICELIQALSLCK